MSDEKSESLDPVIIDLGRKKRKSVKKLRRGEGKLMDEVEDVIQGLQADGHIAADAQPVVVIVREKDNWKRGAKIWAPWLD